MDEQPKVKGPASYFPAIEQKYGQPIVHWLTLLAGREERKHMALVAWLRTNTPWVTAMPMPWWPTFGAARCARRGMTVPQCKTCRKARGSER